MEKCLYIPMCVCVYPQASTSDMYLFLILAQTHSYQWKKMGLQALLKLRRKTEGRRSQCPLCARNSSVSHLFSYLITTFYFHNLNWDKLSAPFWTHGHWCSEKWNDFPGQTTTNRCSQSISSFSRFFPLCHIASLCGYNYSHPFYKYALIYSDSRHWK